MNFKRIEFFLEHNAVAKKIAKWLSAKQKFYAWLSFRLLFSRQVLFGGSAPLSFLGLVLGVAALVASMSVMRGFESSLKRAMIDVTSDIQIIKKGRLIESWDEFSAQIYKLDSSIQKIARFAYTEAVMAHKGQVSGVLVQGVEFDQIKEILNLEARIFEGGLPQQESEVAIGVGLARRYNLKIGDEIYIAVSLSTPFEDSSFKRQVKKFKVLAKVDFGKNEWNERLVLSRLLDFQNLTQIGDRYTGAFVKINDSDAAPDLSVKIEDMLGAKYAVLNWYEVNKNLFKAVRYEMIIIFFVVFLIVIVAAFNISSTLYVLIRQRYKDIAILKSIGASKSMIQTIFVVQGLWVAFAGCFLGFIIGVMLSKGFMLLQKLYPVISGSVYKIDRIDTQINLLDFVVILIATASACLLATYPPARRGSELTVVEGLRKE